MAAGKKLSVDGLIFLGYPLHPAGDLSRIRDAHLYQIEVPMLFFSGQEIACVISESLNGPEQTVGPLEAGHH